jgi:large subunit ribosomal protein L29
MAKKSDFKELSAAELEKRIRDTQDQLVSLRLRKQTGQVEKPHQLKDLRKEIARCNTLLNQKRRAEQAAA